MNNVHIQERCDDMQIKANKLLLVAGLVWCMAGIQVLKIGIQSYEIGMTFWRLLCSVLIFLVFWFLVFGKLVKKHTKRILSYQNKKKCIIHFFDKKSFWMMAVMMTLGILLRVTHLVPMVGIAVFYSGLGMALTLAGIAFFVQYKKISYAYNMKKERSF